MFKKLITLVAIVAFATGVANAQTGKDFGFRFASDYGKYVMHSTGSTAAGAIVVTIQGDAFATTPGGKQFYPINTNTPLIIDDEVSASRETVTPSAFTCAQNGFQSTCTFSATMGNAHTGNFTIKSGTFGLCEARNDTTNGVGTVVVSDNWGGTTATITSSTLGGACDSATVPILDTRRGAFARFISNGTTYTANLGSVVPALTTATENGNGIVQYTTLTFNATALTVTDALAYAGLEVYDFPEGRILVLGVTGSLQFAVTSTRSSTINDSASLTWGLGTVTASNVTLSSTMQDLIPVQTKVLSAATTALNTASSAALAASAQFDGTATAKKAFLNTSFVTGTDIDGDGTMTATGTITVSWINLGDY